MKKIMLFSLGFFLPPVSYSADTPSYESESIDRVTIDNITSLHNESDNNWKVKLGFLQETENVEGQADKDGTYIPTYYLFTNYKKWSLWLALHQEYYSTDYSATSRGNWLNRHELTLRYSLIDENAISFGISGGFTDYLFRNKGISSEGKRFTTSTNAQRYAIQPDWDVALTDKLRFNGWFAYYEKFNNLEKVGYTKHQIETESGPRYNFNDNVSLQMNFYFNRGWDDGKDRYGQFSDPQIRGYLPINITLLESGKSTLTPYFRASLGGWGYDASQNTNDDAYFNRFGFRWDQPLPYDWLLSLDYAYELRTYHDALPGEASKTKFHYTALGLSYQF